MVANGINPDERWTSSPNSWPPGKGEGKGERSNQSPGASGVISHDCAKKPPQKPAGWGSQSFQAGEHLEVQGERQPWEGAEALGALPSASHPSGCSFLITVI